MSQGREPTRKEEKKESKREKKENEKKIKDKIDNLYRKYESGSVVCKMGSVNFTPLN